MQIIFIHDHVILKAFKSFLMLKQVKALVIMRNVLKKIVFILDSFQIVPHIFIY
jgi:hypothetical protein